MANEPRRCGNGEFSATCAHKDCPWPRGKCIVPSSERKPEPPTSFKATLFDHFAKAVRRDV